MRFLAALALTAMVAGCSLLVSTSDLAGGAPDPGSPDVAASLGGDAEPGGLVDGRAPAADAGTSDGHLAGLVGTWLFDDGTPNDTSGRGRDGALDGDAEIVTTDRGKAVRVHTAGHFTVAALGEGAFPKSGTISLWFQYATMNAALEQGIFDRWNAGRNHVFVRHPNDDDIGRMQIAFQKAADQYELVTGFELAANTWSHVVVAWDAAETLGRVYIDGKNILSANYPSGGFVPNGQQMTFGDALDGLIDDVRLYDRPLTEEEVSGLR